MVASALNHYRAGSGDPVVLVHGLGSSWRAWHPVLSALALERDVLALDLPGFGRSAPLPTGVRPTASALADAVERELDAAGLATAHLVGNSLGGWVSLELARRGRARSVVAISPAGLLSASEREEAVRKAKATYAMARAVASGGPALLGLAAASTLVFSQVHSRPWRVAPAEAAHALTALAGSLAFLETLEWTINRHEAEGLDQVPCRALIAWGTDDRVLPPSCAPQFTALIPGAELRLLPGLGHIPMPDDPVLVARMILEFTAGALIGDQRSAPDRLSG